MKNKTWIGRLKKVWPGCRRFARRHAKSALGLLVAISTVAPLVTPALTLSIPVSCGLEEHTHTDACYGEPMPVCDQKETEGHVHTEDCYAPVLLCGLTEHTHTAACGKQAEQIPSGETPGTEEIPGTSGPGEIPSTEEVPGTSESTETSGTEEVPETSESTETSGTEEIPGTSESTGTPGTDEIPGTSESTETPGTEETPGTSEPGETPSTGEAAVIIDSDEIPMDTESLGAQNAALYSAEVPGGNCGTVTITGKTDYGYIDTYEVADNLTWTFQDGILTISGTGEMGDFGSYYETRTGYDEYEGSYYEYESYIGSVDCPWEDVKSEIKQVVVEEGVTSIGGGAFRYHSNLEGITLPESLETIGKSAFESCSSLEGITLPESLKTIGEGAFNSCRNLISASLPSGLTEISNSLFSSCEKLTEITIPEGVTSIGESAFSSCRSLNGIALPESVTSIGASAFSYCENIKEINLPSGVTEIGGSAFSGTAITEIKLPDGLTTLGAALSGCNTLERVTLPSGITEIAGGAFNGCSSLKSIELPEGITSIGDYAFDGCAALTEIRIPSTVTSIGEFAFQSSGITKFEFIGDKLEIGGGAFYYCGNLTSVNIDCKELEAKLFIYSSSWDYAEIGTFPDCRNLETVVIRGLNDIPNGMFSGCEKLISVDIEFSDREDGLHKMGSSVFYGCSSLEKLQFPEGITEIPSYTAYGCASLKEVMIPDSVTSIGYSAFSGCTGLQTLELPESVTSIGYSAFSGCSGLQTLELPDSITTLESYAFQNCTGLQTVKLSNGLTSIQSGLFDGCTGLKSLTIPVGVKKIYSPAFLNGTKVEELIINTSDFTFDSGYQTATVRPRVILGGEFEGELSGSVLNSLMKLGMASFGIVPNKTITADLSMYADKMQDPFSTFTTSSNYCSDEKGCLYRIDEETGEAVLVYFFPECGDDYTIPAKVSGGGGAEYRVTGVASHAFIQADKLTSLSFEAPEQITLLERRAFMGAFELAAINGRTTEPEIAKLLAPGVKIGTAAFGGTKIGDQAEHNTQTGSFVIWGAKEDGTTFPLKVELTDNFAVDTTISYTGYTGQRASLRLSIGNQNEEDINTAETGLPEAVGFYLHLGNEKGQFTDLSDFITKSNNGTSWVEIKDKSDKYTVGYARAEKVEDDWYYFEFKYESGTAEIPFTVMYPNRTAGGDIEIYPSRETAGDSGEYIGLSWITLPDKFVLNNMNSNLTGKLINHYEGETTEGQENANSEIVFDEVKNADSNYSKQGLTMVTERMTPSGGELASGYGKDGLLCIHYTIKIDLKETALTLTDRAIEKISNGTFAFKKDEDYQSNRQGFYFKAWDKMEWDAENEQLTLVYSSTDIYTKNGNSFYYPTYIYDYYPNIHFTDDIFKVKTSIDELEGNETFTFTMKITAEGEYQYSQTKPLEGESIETVTASVEEPDIEVQVSEEEITITNVSILPYKKLQTMTYNLPRQYYFTAQSLAAIFSEDKNREITSLVIKDARIIKEEYLPGGEQDGAYYPWSAQPTPLQYVSKHTDLVPRNDDYTKERDGATIRVTWGDDDLLHFTLDEAAFFGLLPEKNACEPDAAKIQQVFDEFRFAVSNETTYSLEWDFNKTADPYVLCGSGVIRKKVPAYIKDALIILDEDTTAGIKQYVSNGGDFKETDCTCYLSDDSIKTPVRKNGDIKFNSGSYQADFGSSWYPVTFKPTVGGKKVDSYQSGDVLNYDISYNLRGAGLGVETGPVEVQFEGKQCLLGRTDNGYGRPEWADAGQEAVKEENSNVYWYELMPREEPYRNVYLNKGFMVDSVIVSEAADGKIITRVRYFESLKNNTADAATMGKEFKTVVMEGSNGQSLKDPDLSVDCWLGAHEGHRVYKGWIHERTVIEKEIVKIERKMPDGTTRTIEEDPAKDESQSLQPQPWKYATLHQGDKVTYRIAMSYVSGIKGSGKVINSGDFYDLLPELTDYRHLWVKNQNIWIRIEPSEGRIVNADTWYVEAKDKDGYGLGHQWFTPESFTQKIKFGSGFSATLNEKPIYIYVTLQYPESDKEWQEYLNKYGGETLVNTAHLINADSTASHMLAAPTVATLQKGVARSMEVPYMNDYPAKPLADPYERLFYSNDDQKQHSVYYYIAVRNAGNSRLYLTEIQDQMPEGFTYIEKSVKSTPWGSPVKNFFTAKNNATPEHTTFYKPVRGIGVTGEATDDGRIRFTFAIDSYYAKYDSCEHFDAERQLCFLNPGEMLFFAFACRTNKYNATNDIATGYAAMPYYQDDDLLLGLTNGEHRYAMQIDAGYSVDLANDGDSIFLTDEEAKEKGFEKPELKQDKYGGYLKDWLSSEVTVSRGGFKPGVTVTWSGAKDSNGTSLNLEKDTITQSANLEWTVQVKNGGSSPTYDYVITDEIQKGNEFVQQDTLEIRFLPLSGSYGSSFRYVLSLDWEDGQPSINVDKTKYFISNRGYPDTTENGYTTVRGAELTAVMEALKNSSIRVEDTEFGKRFSLYLKGEKLAIPSQYSANVKLLTKREGNSYVAGTLFITNVAHLTPVSDNWVSYSAGALEKDYEAPFLDGQPKKALTDNAMAIIGDAILTNAQKRVKLQNDTSSAEQKEMRVSQLLGLEQKESVITYELTAHHSEKATLTDMVMIDSLPQSGDTAILQGALSRGSEYAIVLAENPSFELVISHDSGETEKIEEGYAIYLSKSREIVDDDWNAEKGDASKWVEYSEELQEINSYHTVKLVVTGETAEKIDQNSEVILRFNCMIPEDIQDSLQPGMTAYNDFAYQFQFDRGKYLSKSNKTSVGFYGVPELIKRLQTVSREKYVAEETMNYRFLVYTGESVSLSKGFTEEELNVALAGRKLALAELTIEKGKSESDSLLLDSTGLIPAIFQEGKFVEDADGSSWTWEAGKKYSLVELPVAADKAENDYHFNSINDMPALSYSFTYDPSMNQPLSCINQRKSWSIRLNKVDEADNSKVLRGALFGLYTSKDSEAMSDERFALLESRYPDLTIPRTAGDNDTYKLMAVSTTDSNGQILWQDLTTEEYLYKELRAPDGYQITGNGYGTVKNSSKELITIAQTVTNKAGYEIPKTGGPGTFAYILSGTALMFGALGLMLARYGRRKRTR